MGKGKPHRTGTTAGSEPRVGVAMKNIVICCDGTGNEYGTNNANVVGTYALAPKTATQLAYYDHGVGTGGWAYNEESVAARRLRNRGCADTRTAAVWRRHIRELLVHRTTFVRTARAEHGGENRRMSTVVELRPNVSCDLRNFARHWDCDV